MAFNIRRRAGWNRLWIVGSLVWIGAVVVIAADEAPRKIDIEERYERALANLTPEAVAEHNTQAERLPSLYKPMTPKDVSDRRYAAQQRFNSDWANFSTAQRRYWTENALVALLVPVLFYGACWLVVFLLGWIAQGFRTTSSK